MPTPRARKAAPKPAPKLSHVGKNSRARMVDVTDKAETVREAKASGRINISKAAMALVLILFESGTTLDLKELQSALDLTLGLTLGCFVLTLALGWASPRKGIFGRKAAFVQGAPTTHALVVPMESAGCNTLG